jgi:hypothetical protein
MRDVQQQIVDKLHCRDLLNQTPGLDNAALDRNALMRVAQAEDILGIAAKDDAALDVRRETALKALDAVVAASKEYKGQGTMTIGEVKDKVLALSHARDTLLKLEAAILGGSTYGSHL